MVLLEKSTTIYRDIYATNSFIHKASRYINFIFAKEKDFPINFII